MSEPPVGTARDSHRPRHLLSLGRQRGTVTDDRAELAEAIGRVETALASLRSELETAAADGEAGDGEGPPPEELLRIADEVAIPAMEATLLANQRALAATRDAVAAAREAAGVSDPDEASEEGDPGSDPDAAIEADAATDDTATDDSPTPVEVDVASDSGRSDAAPETDTPRDADGRDLEPAISQVEDALDDLRGALEDTESPVPEPAQEVLHEARSLREEIDWQVADAADRADRARRTQIPVGSQGSGQDGEGDAPDANGDQEADSAAPSNDDGSPTDDVSRDELDELDETDPVVDVEAELETIKREYEQRRETLPDWATDGESDGEPDEGSAGDAADGADSDDADPEPDSRN